MQRRKTQQFQLGNVAIGGDAPISVQSMTKTDTRDTDATIAQIHKLTETGCEIVRSAVIDEDAAKALAPIKKATSIPLVADIHFDYKLAMIALKAGVDGLRLNPGNIGAQWKVVEVVKAATDSGAPIRIGVNSGSVEKEYQRLYGGPTALAMVESALAHVRVLEDLNFCNIKVSLKATDIERNIEANRLFASKSDIPIHLGITEAGTAWTGSIKSAAGMAVLLAEGIGDTLRVSLTGDPAEEVRVGWQILKSLDLRQRGVTIISCPTCGRLERPIEDLAYRFEQELAHIDHPFHLAVMGCSVNGPGESKGADIGVVAHKSGKMRLYKDGHFWRNAPCDDVVDIVKAQFEKKLSEL